MILHITRDSVCMGDDCLDHGMDFEISSNSSCLTIMTLVKQEYYLPSVDGSDVVWVLENSKQEEVLSYFTLKDDIIKTTTKESVQEVCNGNNTLHFAYYSSPCKRGKYIYDLYKGSKYGMWHDGWLDEYKRCNITEEMEKAWEIESRVE